MSFGHFQIRLLFFLAVILGLSYLPKINLRLNPSPRTQTLSITFIYPSASPERVEAEVTSVIEAAVSRLENLKEIQSLSQVGKGSITMDFDDNVSMTDVRLIVSATIRQIYPSLPPEAHYPRIHYKSELESHPIVMVYTALSHMDHDILKEVIDRDLILPLTSLPGIYEIELTGVPSLEYVVMVNEEKMTSHGITNEDIKKSFAQWSKRHPLGIIVDDKNNEMYSLQYNSDIFVTTLENDILQLPLKYLNNRLIYVKDVASIHHRQVDPSSHYRINGKKSYNLLIRSDPNVNQISLATTIKEQMSSIEQILPDQVELVLVTDNSEYLKKELTTILSRMAGALGLLLLFMIVIYRNFSKLLVIWCSFATSIVLSFIIYFAVGIQLHLYSLAGLTLSLGLVLDNLVVSADHLRYQKDQRIILALLAATLTTVGAISIIFFISPEYREQLTDFVWIFIINLAMSLLVALLFMPTIVPVSKRRYKVRRGLLQFNRIFIRYTQWITRRKWIPTSILLLTFGLPIFMLPSDIKDEGAFSKYYNQIMHSTYGEKVHPFLSKYFGGSLRLFILDTDRFFFAEQKKAETKLFVRAKVPFGGTTDQVNYIIKDFEDYLLGFPEVKQFHSTIRGPSDASIEISFHESYQEGSFPFQLKARLENKSIDSGSGDIDVYGVGIGFSNAVRGINLNTHLRLLGYNYDQLWNIAYRMDEMLRQNPRIREVYFTPKKQQFKPEAEFLELNLDQRLLSQNPAMSHQTLSLIKNIDPDQGIIALANYKGNKTPIRLTNSDDYKNDIWRIKNDIVVLDDNLYTKNSAFSNISKRKGSLDIARSNQQYQLFIGYDFIGNKKLENDVRNQVINDISDQLPPGYHISDGDYDWWNDQKGEELTYIVLIVIVLIFMISAILFNSLIQAFIPLILIPPSFIGIFLATYWFQFNFDQGGFAALLLVSGLSVNAGIFIINDFNNIRKARPGIQRASAFIKAYNAKIIPITLTALSTILGLLPFLLLDAHEPFWYALALCTIVGTVSSFLGILFLLPIFFGGIRE